MENRQNIEHLASAYESMLRRLGHRIHDQPMQYAVGAKMWLDAAQPPHDGERTSQCLQQAIDACGQTIRALRHIMNEAIWSVPDNLGLAVLSVDIMRQFNVKVEISQSDSQALDSMGCTKVTGVLVSRALAEILFEWQAAGLFAEVCTLALSIPDKKMTLQFSLRQKEGGQVIEMEKAPEAMFLRALGGELLPQYNLEQAIVGWKLMIPLAEIEALR